MIPQNDLVSLNGKMERAFARGDSGGLTVLGYGEITTVVLLESTAGKFACKRLPPFASHDRFEAYRRVFDQYYRQVNESGVHVIESWIQTLESETNVIAYCVQPALPTENLATRVLSGLNEEHALILIERILRHIVQCVGHPALGLDGQLSNWIVQGDDLLYLDVTTPLLRHEDGAEALDTDLFLAAAPMGTRGLLKGLILRDMLDKYHSVRGVILDLLGNLIKERLERFLVPFLHAANQVVDEPFTEAEIRNYYQWDARTWIAWQLLRRADRWLKLKILRNPYPFLLPGRIDRNV